jgi:anti-anti-sigma regulatory factor
MGPVSGTDFQLSESQSDEGLRLSVVGALDADSAPALEQRLAELRVLKTPVRLDLARLEAIDHVGVQLLIDAHAEALLKKWKFEIEPDVSPAVAGVLRLAHLGGLVTDET